jgi:hypothetical protein
MNKSSKINDQDHGTVRALPNAMAPGERKVLIDRHTEACMAIMLCVDLTERLRRLGYEINADKCQEILKLVQIEREYCSLRLYPRKRT